MTFPLSFSTVSKSVSSVRASLSFSAAFRSSSYISAFSHKSLSDTTNVCDDAVCSSNVYPSQSISPSKHLCLNNVRPNKPVISSNFYVSKPVCSRNIGSSRSISSSDIWMFAKVVMLVKVNPFVQVMFPK